MSDNPSPEDIRKFFELLGEMIIEEMNKPPVPLKVDFSASTISREEKFRRIKEAHKRNEGRYE